MIGGKKYSMDLESANSILQNVLKENNKEPNTIPFNKLVQTNKVNTAYAKICRITSIVLLVAICVAPLFFGDRAFSVHKTGAFEGIIVADHQLYEDHFVMYLKGNNINYHDIYARKNDGTFIFPSEIDEEAGVVTFPYSGGGMIIFVPDAGGRILQAVLSEQESR